MPLSAEMPAPVSTTTRPAPARAPASSAAARSGSAGVFTSVAARGQTVLFDVVEHPLGDVARRIVAVEAGLAELAVAHPRAPDAGDHVLERLVEHEVGTELFGDLRRRAAARDELALG